MHQRILVVIGNEEDSRAAVSESLALARVHGAELLLFPVLPRYVLPVADMPMVGSLSPDDFQREVTGNAERQLGAAKALADAAGVPSRQALGAGLDDAQCIVEAAQTHRCQAIVVASAGGNAVMRLVGGSVIPGLITLSTLPVLVVRQSAGEPASHRRGRRRAPGRGDRRPARSSARRGA